jgi:GntR family transcriptional regulator
MATRSPTPTVSRDSAIPLYRQIREQIEREITSGRLEPGSRVASEGDICRAFGVSRITARQALQELVAEGLLVRVAGKGTFVRMRPRVERLTRLTGFGENMRAIGRRPGYRTLKLETVAANLVVAARLGLRPSEPVVRIARVLLADDEEVALQESHLPARLLGESVAGLTVAALDAGSLYDFLEREAGLRLHRAVEEVEPAVADRAAARALRARPGALLLRVQRLVYEAGGIAVEDVTMLYRADRYRFRLELVRAPSRP